jgi:hypothetical protein
MDLSFHRMDGREPRFPEPEDDLAALKREEGVGGDDRIRTGE